MSKFKEGDVVRLKSGGPAMTIRSVRNSSIGLNIIHTNWFVDFDLREGTFVDKTLEKIPKRK